MKTPLQWTCLLLLGLFAPACHHLDYNFREVEPGAFYRSGQMPGWRLERAITNHGIGTVINLRGSAPEEDWYITERAVCARRGAAHHDLDWTMRALPTPESLAQLLAWYRTEEPAILVHCQGGTHRSGVASACYLLDKGASLDTARDQLGVFFNDAPIGAVLDLYAGSSLPFAEWVETQYPRAYAEAAAD